MPSRRHLTSRLLILLLLPLVAGIVWLASDTQRSMAESSFDEAANIDQARVAMFDLRAALRTSAEKPKRRRTPAKKKADGSS